MSIEFLPPDDEPMHCQVFSGTHSGGSIYHGQYWSSASQAHYNSLGIANLGTGSGQAFLANQHALAQAFAQQKSYAQNALGPYHNPQPEPVEDAGISAGEIIAHRAWRVKWPEALLQSMAVETIWAPNEPMTGDPHRHGGPAGCGVHAFKTASAALTEYGNSSVPVAFGTVLLWGEVVEHELGYRAEFGKVNSLDILVNPSSADDVTKNGWRWSWWAGWQRKPWENNEQLLQHLRQHYGV